MGRIDPCGSWPFGRRGDAFDEAVRVGGEGSFESALTGGVDFVGLSIVDLVGRHQAEPQMMVLAVVPAEEAVAFAFSLRFIASSCRQKRKGWTARLIKFLTGIVRGRRHSQVRNSP